MCAYLYKTEGECSYPMTQPRKEDFREIVQIMSNIFKENVINNTIMLVIKVLLIKKRAYSFRPGCHV